MRIAHPPDRRPEAVLESVPGTVAQHGLAKCEGIGPMTELAIRLHLEPRSKMMSRDHQKRRDGQIVRPKGRLEEAFDYLFTLSCLLAALEPD